MLYEVITTNDDSEETGIKGMQQFLKYFVPDAIVTTDDLIAFGACQKGYESIGEYVPVVGFNNTPVSIYRNPQFSSVEIFAEKLGYHSAKTLIDLLEGRAVTEKHFTVATKFYDSRITSYNVCYTKLLRVILMVSPFFMY